MSIEGDTGRLSPATELKAQLFMVLTTKRSVQSHA